MWKRIKRKILFSKFLKEQREEYFKQIIQIAENEKTQIKNLRERIKYLNIEIEKQKLKGR